MNSGKKKQKLVQSDLVNWFYRSHYTMPAEFHRWHAACSPSKHTVTTMERVWQEKTEKLLLY